MFKYNTNDINLDNPYEVLIENNRLLELQHEIENLSYDQQVELASGLVLGCPANQLTALFEELDSLKNKTVKKNNQVLKLTLTEYSILWVFFQNINKVISYKYLLEKIWGENFQRENQYLRVYISQLRKKIEDDPANPKMILTESGMGYRFSLIN